MCEKLPAYWRGLLVPIFACKEYQSGSKKITTSARGDAALFSSTDLSSTPLSGDPPHLGSRRAWPLGAPSGGRRGFGTVPSLLRGARACSAAPIAGTRPSACLSLVLVRRSSHYSTCCIAAPENADLCASWVALVRSAVLTHERA